VIAALLASLLLAATPAKAARPAKVIRPARVAAAVQAPPQSPYRRSPYVGAISMDAGTSNVIFKANENVRAYPASVTKLMTALLVLEDIRSGRYSAGTEVTATPEVNCSEPSWVGLRAGDRMTVDSLMTALMVESANDAAVALAVNASGSLSAFVERMNVRARELGMLGTAYYNPNGLPPKPKYPWKKFNVTTAADQAKLALALVNDNPRIFDYVSVKTANLVKTPSGYRVAPVMRVGVAGSAETVLKPGERIVKLMRNHNNVMVKDRLKLFNPDGSEVVDGLKTGYIDAGGSSVVVTGARKRKRAIAVVLGSSTSSERDEHAQTLIADALGTIAW